MAQSKNNIVTHGLSGKVGNILVFSQRGNKTVVSKAPKAHTGEISEKQKAHHARFQRAILYAKAAVQDPVTKAQYAAKAKEGEGLSAYNVAVADLLHAPEIEAIDLGHYTGNPGDTITIRVTDDFQVAAVKVAISNADGSLVEEGSAVQQGADWIFTATVKNDTLAGDKITIQATDVPANVAEMSQVL